MSHELKTPLNAVLGFSEIIRDEMLGAGRPAGLSRLCRRHPHQRHAAAGDHQRRAGRVAAGRRPADHRGAPERRCRTSPNRRSRWRAPPPATSAASPSTCRRTCRRCMSIRAASPRRWAIFWPMPSNSRREGGAVALTAASAARWRRQHLAVEDTGIGMAPGNHRRGAGAVPPARRLAGAQIRRRRAGPFHRHGAGRTAWRHV